MLLVENHPNETQGAGLAGGARREPSEITREAPISRFHVGQVATEFIGAIRQDGKSASGVDLVGVGDAQVEALAFPSGILADRRVGASEAPP